MSPPPAPPSSLVPTRPFLPLWSFHNDMSHHYFHNPISAQTVAPLTATTTASVQCEVRDFSVYRGVVLRISPFYSYFVDMFTFDYLFLVCVCFFLWTIIFVYMFGFSRVIPVWVRTWLILRMTHTVDDSYLLMTRFLVWLAFYYDFLWLISWLVLVV